MRQGVRLVGDGVDIEEGGAGYVRRLKLRRRVPMLVGEPPCGVQRPDGWIAEPLGEPFSRDDGVV
jgi:hypothetical protein